jgi:hypothetical protein
MDDATIRDLSEDPVAQPPQTSFDLDQLIVQSGRGARASTLMAVAHRVRLTQLGGRAVPTPGRNRPTLAAYAV